MQIFIYNIQKTEIEIDKKRLRSNFNKIKFFEKISIKKINFIFVNDRYIKILNNRYLHHNYPTDIIAFNSNSGNIISGDVFISIDTIKYNAVKFNNSLKNELIRIMVHGILHLMNYNDKLPNEGKVMRKKENHYLKMFKN